MAEKLVPKLNYDRLKTHLPDIYGSLKNLLETCTEEMLNLVLETLTAIIQVCTLARRQIRHLHH